MEQPQPERKLAAILAADVEGYSRLMHADEERTLRTLKAHRKIVADRIVADHGVIFGSAGDSVLAEFPSVVEAFHCAVAVQRALARANAALAPEARMQFRIGLHVGDVIVTDGDIFGEGVNIAARIETLAPPGGICVSRAVRDQLRDRVSEPFEDLGEREVKNIARAVRVYRVCFDPLAEPDEAEEREAAEAPARIAPTAKRDDDPKADDAGEAEIVFWKSVEASGDDAEYRLYLKHYPQGLFADLAQARLARGAPDANPQVDRQAELLFWESVKDAGNPEMIRAYLEKYPEGEFRPLAEIALSDLAD